MFAAHRWKGCQLIVEIARSGSVEVVTVRRLHKGGTHTRSILDAEVSDLVSC